MAIHRHHHNYLNFIVMMKPLEEWLRLSRPEKRERNVLAGGLIHICLSLHHVFVYYLDRNDDDQFLEILSCYDSRITQELDYCFFFHMYHAVVGRWGHVKYTQTYADIVRETLRNIMLNTGSRTLILARDDEKMSIPHPCSPPHIRPRCRPQNTEEGEQ